MGIKHWPASERPREKLLAQGSASLSDAELLAIFLRTGVKGLSAVAMAQRLLTDFEGLRGLLEANQTSFCQHHGLGPAKYAQLQAVLEMGRRHAFSTLQRGQALSSPQQAEAYLHAKLRSHQREVFACLFMDSQNRVIRYEELFFGTIDAASVHPREVIKKALEYNAAAVILAHNHPSGICEPSQADERITTTLKEALLLVDIRVLDHIIVGDGHVSSLAQLGKL